MTENQCEETIQDIAYKLMLEQSKNDNILNGPIERTVFVLGSKGGVGIYNIILAYLFIFHNFRVKQA